MVLFYSNSCESCKKIIGMVSKNSIKKEMKFICVDKFKEKNGKRYAVLPKGGNVLIPSAIDKVPAMMFMNKGGQILFGDDILLELQTRTNFGYNTQQNCVNKETMDGKRQLECYILGKKNHGVISDKYCYYDQIRGVGFNENNGKRGTELKQRHHYRRYGEKQRIISTPADDYVPDKVRPEDIERHNIERNKIK